MSLLRPGSHRIAGLLDDRALVAAMLSVEHAWLWALVDGGAATAAQAEAVAAITSLDDLDPSAVEAAGNPVPALVAALRRQIAAPETAALVHRGLTSQDVLDTALMLVARDVLAQIRADLGVAATGLGRLADEHRTSVMAGRTLTQYAVPVTFGLVAAQWTAAILDARDRMAEVARSLPVQCGGAAGTLALAGSLVADPVATAEHLAGSLGLTWPGPPWHTRRTPITRLGDALVETCDALGVLASDVLVLARPELGELTERLPAGRGGSSTMPHKQNPVLSVLIKSAALQAPQLGAQLHQSSSAAVDQRPDGAWHAEWPALLRLLELTAVAAAQAAELVGQLDVHPEVMAERVDAARAELLAESGREIEPAQYLGMADAFVDHVLGRLDD